MIKKSLIMLIMILGASSAFADINIYTDRSAALMDPVVEMFEAETGERVNYIRMSGSEIITRLQAEGENTPADIVIAKDMLYLNEMAALDLLQPMTASTSHVPDQMQNPDGLWAAFTMRARTIVYNMDLVDPADAPVNYADLADQKWEGKLCLRTSANSYNIGLAAGFITDFGYSATQDMMQGWVDNLAQAPLPNDRSVLEAIENEECEVGIVNSYYLGQENSEGNNLNVGIIFADQDIFGVHVNGTGAGVTAATKRPELANKFMDIILSDDSQYSFSNIHYDYPVSPENFPQTLIADWGSFFINTTNWSFIGDNADAAIGLFSEIGYE